MCFGNPNKASDAAQQAENERMAAIKATQAQVNQVFDSPERAADIDRAMGGMRDLEMAELNRRKAETDRQLKFALARNGQTGGSTQVDQNRTFADQYGRALLGVERNVQNFGAGIRSADQDARARLISLATQGLDATTGARQAAEAMRVNLASGQTDQNLGSIANAFSGFNDFLKSSREAAERRRADQVAGMNYYGGFR